MTISDRPAGAPVAADANAPNTRLGIIAAFATYGSWGLLPLFFKLLESVEAPTIVASRVFFSLIVVWIVLVWARRMGEIRIALGDRKTLRSMAISAALLTVNWLLFVWAVTNGRVLEASLGYFITPLVNVGIGIVLLGENQTRLQILAIGLAVIAVAIQWLGVGNFPWVALGLAFTFGFYGYFRKTANVGSAPGLFVETLLMVPVALGYLTWLFVTAGPGPYADPWLAFYLALTGPVTAFGLVMFAYAARQLRLSTIGMFQYIAPSLQFLLAVFVFGEALRAAGLLSFALIWVSLAIFSYDSWRKRARTTVPTP